MEKFSKVKKRYNIDKSNDKNVQYDDNYIKVVSYEDWSTFTVFDIFSALDPSPLIKTS